MKQVKVFFIPYAGASTTAYYSWKRLFPENYDICLPELAGRGERSKTPFYKNVDEAVIDLSEAISSCVGTDRYVIFGHSMGALFAYEVYHRFLENNQPLPEHMFFSGRKPPDMEMPGRFVYKYDDIKLLNAVSYYGGVTEAMRDPDVMKYYLPIIRADFTMLGKHAFRPKAEKIRCGVSVLYGDQDYSTPWFDVEHWEEHTQNGCRIYKIHGDHFFINQETPEVVKIMIDTMTQM